MAAPFKALVLAAGRGRRLTGWSGAQNKCLLPLRGRPLIEYSLANAAAAEVEEIVVVVGYRADEVRQRFGAEYSGRPLRYVHQAQPRGVVHAMECARAAIGGADFLLFLADEVLLRPFHAEMLARFRRAELYAMCGVVRVADRDEVRRTYAVVRDEDSGRILRLIEKPRVPPNDLCGTGNCVLRAAALDYAPRTPIHALRGERELPDLLQCAVDDGHALECFEVDGGYVNVNTPEDVARAERELRRIAGGAPGS